MLIGKYVAFTYKGYQIICNMYNDSSVSYEINHKDYHFNLYDSVELACKDIDKE